MKIRLKHDGGYAGLRRVKFPVEVEAYSISPLGTVRIGYTTMQTIPGFSWIPVDCMKGDDYLFFKAEYEVVEEEIPVVSVTEATPDRKTLLLQLVEDYGVAINNRCYESECGSVEACEEWTTEEYRLLAEITKMINDGV